MTESASPPEWQTRPPYTDPRQREASGQSFVKKIEGTCHCGKVKYWLSRDKPLGSKYCHCTDCQVMHGAPFQWAAIFHKEDMSFEHGVRNLSFYSSGAKKPTHGLPCKVRCDNCGSLIMDEGRNMLLLFPSLLKFEGNEELKRNFQPELHIFYSRRVLDIPDGKPKWSGLDGQSELMSE
ncbi:hypothetical protein ACRALDRAFT_1071051 [Sodiomyces alcalophilus JCM 7366]|uniref:uncharacterized protein n=1 Tax=Sodiomyces alcalophilus JCM 7366 TaxID=591952 RepID=UPI0039B38FBB